MPTHALETVFPHRAHDSGMRSFRQNGKCGEMRAEAGGSRRDYALVGVSDFPEEGEFECGRPRSFEVVVIPAVFVMR